jgi:hypothetical protein
VILQLGFGTFSVFTSARRKRFEASTAKPACPVFRTKSDNAITPAALDQLSV